MILMTQEIKNQLLESSYYPKEEDWMETTVIVKYFYPAGAATWLITGGEEVDGDWMLFGYVTLGYEWEWGSVIGMSQFRFIIKLSSENLRKTMKKDIFSGSVE